MIFNTQTVVVICIVLLLLSALLGFLWVRYRARRERGRYAPPKGERQHVVLESSDLKKTAEELLTGLGGAENLRGVEADGSRLRLDILRYSSVDEAALRRAGVGGVLRPSKTMVHVIIGEQAEELAALLREAAGLV